MTRFKESNRSKRQKENNTCPVEYFIVLPLAGQSNGMAYGEGLPLPETLDKPEPTIMQLARRNFTTPGGNPCHYNELILADHCLHDVQDMSSFNHPFADLNKGQYGCVGQGLHIAKALRAQIPQHVGILLVPGCRGGSAFTQGEQGQFLPASGASSESTLWGINTPLYKDLVSRTKAALDMNPRNVLVGICWMQGEFDLSSSQYYKQPVLFNEMVTAFRNEMGSHRSQCIDFNENNIPWFCGDTTDYWRKTYPVSYDTIYGNYQNRVQERIFYLDFSDIEMATNEPVEDPDILETGYLGSSYRTAENWTTALRGSHFNSRARRGPLAARFADAILSTFKNENLADKNKVL